MKNPGAVQLIMRYYETWAGINAAYERFAARLGVTANLLYLLDLFNGRFATIIMSASFPRSIRLSVSVTLVW